MGSRLPGWRAVPSVADQHPCKAWVLFGVLLWIFWANHFATPAPVTAPATAPE